MCIRDRDKGEPQGEGRFIVSSAVPDSEESRKNGVFSEYTGSWSDGTFEGEGTLTYADGSVVSGEFLSGEYDGLMTTITTCLLYTSPHRVYIENFHTNSSPSPSSSSEDVSFVEPRSSRVMFPFS